jgi:hypothetical protein
MGKFHPLSGYTGTVGNVSIYTLRGSDKPVVRTKGGPTKRQIQTKASFAKTRKNNMEFGGRAKIAGQVMDLLRPFKYLSDYNIAGPLNSLFIPIQALDTEHEHGQRNVVLSRNPGLLQGFNLNRRTPFNTIIANPLEYTLTKETLSASVTFPALIPGINFFNPGKYSWYKFIILFGVIEDWFYSPKGYVNKGGKEVRWTIGWHRETDWMNISPELPSFTLFGSIKKLRSDFKEVISLDSHSCLLGVGIAFGAMPNGHMEMVKYVGGATVLGMV